MDNNQIQQKLDAVFEKLQKEGEGLTISQKRQLREGLKE